MYAIGMCVHARYLLPALVTLGSVADHLPVADRRESAVRVLTNGLSPGQAAVMGAFARRCGFGSFDLRWQADAYETAAAVLLSLLNPPRSASTGRGGMAGRDAVSRRDDGVLAGARAKYSGQQTFDPDHWGAEAVIVRLRTRVRFTRSMKEAPGQRPEASFVVKNALSVSCPAVPA
ncbi:hypothetical protein ACH4XT_20550 [Streptomyces avidinii]|uniref:hypothetical protein n=1 Tax=Streptomyces avidinii TaxID=1895 RepID=UPI0037A20C98